MWQHSSHNVDFQEWHCGCSLLNFGLRIIQSSNSLILDLVLQRSSFLTSSSAFRKISNQKMACEQFENSWEDVDFFMHSFFGVVSPQQSQCWFSGMALWKIALESWPEKHPTPKLFDLGLFLQRPSFLTSSSAIRKNIQPKDGMWTTWKQLGRCGLFSCVALFRLYFRSSCAVDFQEWRAMLCLLVSVWPEKHPIPKLFDLGFNSAKSLLFYLMLCVQKYQK